MSDSYASRLSEYRNKGICGLPEHHDNARTLKLKINKVLEYMQNARRVVFLTGAGISTSAGIPDFRGPKGIWTQEQKQKQQQQNDNDTSSPTKKISKKKRKRTATSESASAKSSKPLVTFDKAQPTKTHCALTHLVNHHNHHNHRHHTDNDCHYFIVTQNVDGLHRRSGLSRDFHSVLHGCVFTECCDTCHLEHFRDDEVQSIRFQPTGRYCDKCCPNNNNITCPNNNNITTTTATSTTEKEEDDDDDSNKDETITNTTQIGVLRDCLLDWEDALPDYDWERSQDECEAADLIIVLGSSLRIEPAASLCTLGKRFVICNLQPTPYDTKAAVILRAPVDHVMTEIMKGLGYGTIETWYNPTTTTATTKIERYWKQPIDTTTITTKKKKKA